MKTARTVLWEKIQFKIFYPTMYFHGARFSNYEAWLSDPTHIKPSAQVVWPIVGQEILNGDVGGGFQGIQITSGFFQLWRASGITSELQLYTTAIGGLIMAVAMFFAGWFHYHKAAPKLEWFQNVESMLNHHLAGLLGLGSLGWAGHQIHISLPVNKLLDAGVDPKEIPLPHDFLLNKSIMADLYPSFSKGLAPFFTLNWSEYSDFLTFKGGLNPVTGGLWLSDTAHHHLAIAVLFLVAGHMYRTNWGIGHSMKEILEAHRGPFTGEGHVGLYEILTTSWHAQLAINLALFGSLSIIVAHHMYAMPPYPYLATDYGTQLSLFTHHMWIGGFCVVGAGAHAAIFMVRDYDPTNNYNNLLDRVIRHRDAIISHLNWVSIFLGFHSFGLYIHNDTMSALGRPQDMFSDTAIQLQPVFAQWIQNTHFLAPQLTAPNALASTSASWGGDIVAVGGKVAMMPISLGTADFLVWVMLDQVKLRYMLEPLVILFVFFKKTFQSYSHCLNNLQKLLGVMENLLGRVNQQVTTNKVTAFAVQRISNKVAALLTKIKKLRCLKMCLFALRVYVKNRAFKKCSPSSVRLAPLAFAKSLHAQLACARLAPLAFAKSLHAQKAWAAYAAYAALRTQPSGANGRSNEFTLGFFSEHFCSAEKQRPKELCYIIQKVGTSETIREAISQKSNFDLTDYDRHKPSHVKKLNISFLIWFIGFIEGDGSFWTRDQTKTHPPKSLEPRTQQNVGAFFNIDQQTKRAEFEITQHIKNIKLLNYIRTNLGFGRVFIFEKNDSTYCRWYTSKRENIIKLIYLFNGNLILEKRRAQFTVWLDNLNQAWGLNIPLKNFNCQISLKNAWLAGFSDADAGFYTNIKQNFKDKKKSIGGYYIQFVTKYYITQHNETFFLNQLRQLVGATNKINTITNGITNVSYNRLEITNMQSIDLLIDYFTKFPLKGFRKIEMLRWARVHGYKNMHVIVTETAAQKLANLLLNLEEPAENISLKTLASFQKFSNDEKRIFIDLPLNQKNPNYKKNY